jgi:hypothetical protein
MKTKSAVLAIMLGAAVQAQADGFRPWGDVVAKGAGVGTNESQGRRSHELGFQPFLETQHRVLDAPDYEASLAADTADPDFGFRPWVRG